jgi:TRAP-type transport system periplasmic protein
MLGRQKNKILPLSLLLIVIGIMIVVYPPASVQAQTKTFSLKYGGFLPAGDAMEATPTWWAQELEKRTGGRVKVTMYYGEALGKQFDVPKLLRSGIADAGQISNAIADFPMMGILFIHSPYIIPNSDHPTSQKVFWTLYNKGLLKELDDFKPLWYQPNAPFYPAFRNKKVTKLEELKGMKMRGLPGMGATIWNALGATAIAMPAADLYTALERGTLDGLMTVPAFVRSVNLGEVAKYWVWQPMMLGGNLMCISKKLWNSFPPDIQDIVEKVSKEAEAHYVKNQPTTAQDREFLKSKGWEVYDLSPEEQEKWRKAAYPVVEKWIADNEAKGLPARQAVEAVKAIK